MKEKKRNEDFQISTAKSASEKVPNMVGTFLTEENEGIQMPATKMESKKVTYMVETFLNSVFII